MLINFAKLIEKYGKPNGIIHIGAHLLEERNDYLLAGLDNTIWVEANPEIFSKISFINNSLLNEKVFNCTISNIDNCSVELNITNNGQSSSILELEKHKIYHPSIFVSHTIKVKTKRMDTLLLENNIKINEYDFLNIDIQGAELLALKGFGELLKNIKYIYIEVNTNNLYTDCALLHEIDDYLIKYNFKRVETKITDFEWGDAFYIKDSI